MDMGIHVDARVTTSLQSFTNNIVVGGDVGLEVVFAGQDPLFTWSHNLVYGNTTDFVGIADPTGANGDVAFDPQLTDIQGTDLHLLPTSPARNPIEVTTLYLPTARVRENRFQRVRG
jgi:hypothetical protein